MSANSSELTRISVGIVVDSFPEVSETFVRNQAIRLGARVYARQPGSLAGDRIPGIRVDYFGPRHALWLHSYAARARRRLGTAYGAQWTRASAARLESWMQHQDVDVVLAQFGPTGLRCAPICQRLDLPLVVHFHGYDLSSLLRNSQYRSALVKTLPSVAGAIVVNDLQFATLVDLGISSDKVHIIECGVDTEVFRPQKRLVSSGFFHFLAVGRLVDKKAPLLTIRAFAEAQRLVPEVRLTMVGGGPLLRDCRRLVRRLALSDGVRLTGPLPADEVRPIFDSANAFVQHSITDSAGGQEGWPIAIAEACSLGLPVVATRHAGIVGQVRHEETGYLVDEGDWLNMGKRMAQLAEEPATAEQMGGRGRRHIRERGDLSKQVARLRAVLEKVARS